MNNRNNSGGGAIFPIAQGRRKMNGPSMDGRINLDPSVVQYIVEASKYGGDVEIRLAAWSKQGQNGRPGFLSLKASIPWEKDPNNPQNQQNQGYPQGQMFPQQNGGQWPQNNAGQYPQNNGSQYPSNNAPQYPSNNGAQQPQGQQGWSDFAETFTPQEYQDDEIPF